MSALAFVANQAFQVRQRYALFVGTGSITFTMMNGKTKRVEKIYEAKNTSSSIERRNQSWNRSTNDLVHDDQHFRYETKSSDNSRVFRNNVKDIQRYVSEIVYSPESRATGVRIRFIAALQVNGLPFGQVAFWPCQFLYESGRNFRWFGFLRRFLTRLFEDLDPPQTFRMFSIQI
uniref:Uncharacterized protein n=1 Tax=Romanomermis culicivorax TaxID=13658 RepID=A0A915K0B2_ROMCU